MAGQEQVRKAGLPGLGAYVIDPHVVRLRAIKHELQLAYSAGLVHKAPDET